jgi:hypothetical protein
VISLTLSTFLIVKEGKVNGAIRDIIVSYTPLIILLNQIIDGHVAKNPTLGVDVGLEDSRANFDITLAFGVDNGLNAVKEEHLFFEIGVDLLKLLTSRDGFTDLLQIG